MLHTRAAQAAPSPLTLAELEAAEASEAEATTTGVLSLRWAQAAAAERIVSAWLSDAPAILEGFSSATGLGRTTVAAAAVSAALAQRRAEAVRAPVAVIVCADVAVARWGDALAKWVRVPLEGEVAAQSISVRGGAALAVLTAATGSAAAAVVHLGEKGGVLLVPASAVSALDAFLASLPAGALATLVFDQRLLPSEGAADGDLGGATLSLPPQLGSLQSATIGVADALDGGGSRRPSPLLLLPPSDVPLHDADYLAHVLRLLFAVPGGGGGAKGDKIADVKKWAICMQRVMTESADARGGGGAEGEAPPRAPASTVNATLCAAANRAIALLYIITPRRDARCADASAAAAAGPAAFGAPPRVERAVLIPLTRPQVRAQVALLRALHSAATMGGFVAAAAAVHSVASVVEPSLRLRRGAAFSGLLASAPAPARSQSAEMAFLVAAIARLHALAQSNALECGLTRARAVALIVRCIHIYPPPPLLFENRAGTRQQQCADSTSAQRTRT